MMQDQKKNSIQLSSVLYVPKLGVNLLSEKRMCEKELQESFNQDGLYMHNQAEQVMIKVSQHEEVYIVTCVARRLNEHALLSFIYAQGETIFSSTDVIINHKNGTHRSRLTSFTPLMHSSVDGIQSAKMNTFIHNSKFRLYHL